MTEIAGSGSKIGDSAAEALREVLSDGQLIAAYLPPAHAVPTG